LAYAKVHEQLVSFAHTGYEVLRVSCFVGPAGISVSFSGSVNFFSGHMTFKDDHKPPIRVPTFTVNLCMREPHNRFPFFANCTSTVNQKKITTTMLPRPLLRYMFTLSVVFYAAHPVADANEYNPCITPYGSPCGPIAECKIDTEVSIGYRCKDLYDKITCPVGCGPKEECKKNKATKIYSCECKKGFYRPKAYLGCIEEGKVYVEEITGLNKKKFRVEDA